MIDLSNNNGGTENFYRIYEAGQRRVFLKVTEGLGFVDHTFTGRRFHAQEAGLKVGGYHFAHPHENSPTEEARFFLGRLGRLEWQTDLRPCLDLEEAPPSPHVGRWAIAFCEYVEREIGHAPIFYSNAYYIEACELSHVPGPLWLASFGRDNGIEYPFAIPHPFKHIAAHQFSSKARVVGVSGAVDISHVFDPHALALR